MENQPKWFLRSKRIGGILLLLVPEVAPDLMERIGPDADVLISQFWDGIVQLAGLALLIADRFKGGTRPVTVLPKLPASLNAAWPATLLALLLLGACAGAQTPAQQVFATKSAYKEVVRVALIYESLPRCTGLEEQLAEKISCARVDVVEVIRKADLSADKALDEAELVVRDPLAGEDKVQLAVRASEAALRTFQMVLTTWGISETRLEGASS